MNDPARTLFQWSLSQVEEKTPGKEHRMALPSVNRGYQDGGGQEAMTLDQALYRAGQHQRVINWMNQESFRFTEMPHGNEQAREGSPTRIGIHKNGGIGQIHFLCDVKIVTAQNHTDRQGR